MKMVTIACDRLRMAQIMCAISGLLTYGWMRRFVSFLIRAHSSPVEKGVKRLLFPAPRQAAQPVCASSGVNAARLTLR